MILALDVHYKAAGAKAVGVLFNWEDAFPEEVIIEYINDVDDYIPGEFYKRELPCLLKIIEQISLNDIDAIVIDGYVYIDNDMNFGLGGRLWEALEKRVPVIGVAKTSFFKNKDTVRELKRGISNSPLYISSIGLDLDFCVSFIRSMKGDYRMPDILTFLDKRTKED
ncbi:endonuclease V [Mucilaginibacter sp. KACC 22773]|uniref:endonuclease V n=1 Tax=Mucilaginibacter sp. KACC 22773 TaxID=3025671 RepID=UPI0023666B6F|nr:endonuclease V [Mucilaginibacter sp. KACC 22773]WDF76528.1 endonuclease V [Mucilaginibacter sp. KACC 22773]